MAHFAEIDNDGYVIRVLVVPDEQESRGQEYLSQDCMLGGTWIQTSYNNNIRKIFASEGYRYLKDFDIFIPPKPYDSWFFDESLLEWVAPVEKPDAGFWNWDEANQNWTEWKKI